MRSSSVSVCLKISSVEAEMWEKTFLLLAWVTSILSENSLVFDVTTIFEAGKAGGIARVHSRTNALGLPFYNGNSILPKNNSLSNIYCDLIENDCHLWQKSGWSSKEVYIPLKMKKFFKFENGLKLKFNQNYIAESNYLFFTSESSEDTAEFFHVVKFERRSESEVYQTLFKHCNLYESGYFTIQISSFSDDTFVGVGCLESRSLGQGSTFDIFQYFFDSKIRGYINSTSWTEWSNIVNVKYFYTNSDSFLQAVEDDWFSVYTSGSEGAEMESPEINVDSTQMCLNIVFNFPGSDSEPLFEIYAQDSLNRSHRLQTINNAKAGWNIIHLNLTIPDSIIGQVSLKIKKITSKDIDVARVGSCNVDGEEVVLLESPPESTYAFSSSLLTATARVLGPVNKEKKGNGTVCLSGGVLTEGGCACRPGFSGSECQLGCGRNRFGHDCGGLCSLRTRECEGLMLCTNPTGCHCAPGYMGSDCKTHCDPGSYGNNCLQSCGHCASSSCDIYTGECGSCKAGYLPPLCRYESVYYASKPMLFSSDYGTVHVTFDPTNYVAVFGTPKLYQIQYRVKNDMDWKIYTNNKIMNDNNRSVKKELISEYISGLKDGIVYEFRILFMDENFNKYDGDLVQSEEIITKCEIPQTIDYKVGVINYTNSLIFSWSYDNTSLHWCPVEEYEVTWKENWQWFTNNTKNNFIELTDLLAGAKIVFKVRAKTTAGFAPRSDIISTRTVSDGFTAVRNLRTVSRQTSSVEIAWNSMTENENEQVPYMVSYKCVEQPSCSLGCQNISEGLMTVKGTRVILTHLVPFTRYWVTVSPQSGLGQKASIYIGTLEDVPNEVPSPSELSPIRTNTSVKVFWDKPDVCSGFLLGYNYQLIKEAERLKVLDSGFTEETCTSFYNLTASTQYIVKVSVVTSGGSDPESYLAINTSTSATVPEAVRNLTVYKRGKGMLGLRWAPPRATYGELKSFSVSYTLGQDVTSHTVNPTNCVIWPDLYCCNIEGLRSNRRYNISVSARNLEVAEDGEMAWVIGLTKETLPTAPQNLMLSSSSPTSVLLRWNHPDLANGIIRTFVISVEETENYDQENCCQIYPILETQVKEEAQTYETEVSGLHPASTYFVSVSAKTVGMGPSQSLVVQTRPPHLPVTFLPRVVVPSLGEPTWQPQQTLPDVNSSEIYTPLVKAHLLLAVINESQPIEVALDSGITDPQLNSLLEKIIGKPFYFVTEYTEEEVVTFAGSLEPIESTWGQPPPSLPPHQNYQLIAAQISEYNSAFNADVRFSQPFLLEF